VARSQTKVLITGETGAGKDVVARHVHLHSPRAHNAFIVVNCASLSETLLESELFGHYKGSFTGAIRDRVGILQQAHRGTVFLDEVGEMSPRMQALLLRFLESGEVQRVGSDGPATIVDVRVIAATNRDLKAMVLQGSFREDLWYRLNVTRIVVPPLRERPEDVAPLVELVLATCGRQLAIGDAALRALEAYDWPGNVRELQNVVQEMAALADGDRLDVGDLPPHIASLKSGPLYSRRERRRRVADDLYEQLTSGSCRFWEDIRPLLLNRDITRADLRQLIGLGLAASGGSYRGLLDQFGMGQDDYKRLLNFLAAHDCSVDHKEFRSAPASPKALKVEWPRASSSRPGAVAS
jgi:transcriptional regulator with GAF, ATPase, and Fis domain